MHIVLVALGFLSGSCVGQFLVSDTEYVLTVDSQIYLCPDDDVSKSYIDVSNVAVLVEGNTTVVSGYLNSLQGLVQNTMLELQIKKEIINRYEMVASHEICDLCKELEDEKSKYKGYFEYFDLQKTCPLEPKEYRINDLVVNTSELPVNAQNAGRYQATLNTWRTNGNCMGEKTLLACMKIDFNIEPDA